MNKTVKQLYDFIESQEYCYFPHYDLDWKEWGVVKSFNNFKVEYAKDFDRDYHTVTDLDSDHLRCFEGNREFTVESHNRIKVIIYGKDFMDRRMWTHRITIQVPSVFIKPYMLRVLRGHARRLENEEEELRRENRRKEIYDNLIKRD
jgi:hypothetical protein